MPSQRVTAFRQRLAARRGDKGFTLIEMLVSMIVFSIAIGMVYTAVILVDKKLSSSEQSSEAVSQLRQALEQIDRQVRSGNVLYSPANEKTWLGAAACPDDGANAGMCMRIFTQSNGLQKCVQWQVMADPVKPTTQVLRFRGWATDWQTGGAIEDWQTVARGLQMGATYPFQLDVTSTYSSRLLHLQFLAYDARTKKTVTIQSSLSGRNTNYGYDAGICTPVPPA